MCFSLGWRVSPSCRDCRYFSIFFSRFFSMSVPCSLPQEGTCPDDISEFCPQGVPAGAQMEKEGEVRAFTGLTPSPGCHLGLGHVPAPKVTARWLPHLLLICAHRSLLSVPPVPAPSCMASGFCIGLLELPQQSTAD